MTPKSSPGFGKAVIHERDSLYLSRFHLGVSGNFASHYRSRQIRSRLETRNGWRPEEMLSVQTDVYSAFSLYLARAMVAKMACARRQGGSRAVPGARSGRDRAAGRSAMSNWRS